TLAATARLVDDEESRDNKQRTPTSPARQRRYPTEKRTSRTSPAASTASIAPTRPEFHTVRSTATWAAWKASTSPTNAPRPAPQSAAASSAWCHGPDARRAPTATPATRGRSSRRFKHRPLLVWTESASGLVDAAATARVADADRHHGCSRKVPVVRAKNERRRVSRALK